MMVVKTKGSACTSGCTCLDTAADTHARSCYCMNDSCSVTAPALWKNRLMMLSTDGGGERRGRRKKKSHRRFERASLPLGENESYFVLQKTAWPLMRKARTNTMLRTLIPQSCQQPRKIAEHDEWWKKGNRAVTDKEASIIHISCVHECARVHDTATVF